MKLLQIFRLVLAVVSLTDIVFYQQIGKPVREFFGWTHDVHGDRLALIPEKPKLRALIGEALGCFRCTSVWVAIALVSISWLPGYKYIEAVLAVSWVATHLNEVLSSYYNR